MSRVSSRRSVSAFSLLVAAHALAQVFVAYHAFAAEPEASATPVDSGTDSASSGSARFDRGFEAGLRLGAALPLGKAGRDVSGSERKLGDLAAWRAPVWVDVAYRASPALSYGVYGQLGFGGTGDGCVGKCDFTDLRIGVQGMWRFKPESSIDPWLGVGAGWESMSYRSLATDTGIRTTELLGGPEALLQGGLELRVEKSLMIGPFVSAGIGSYLRDSYKCAPEGLECPTGSSVAGSGLHSWIGFGLSARYSP